MIDAYEIGIQLMLQDDVSAGLAIINRELAEVDQAIAATSANLSGLVRTAETATKAVSTNNGRSGPVISDHGSIEVAAERSAQNDAERETNWPVAPRQEDKGVVAAAPSSEVSTPTILAQRSPNSSTTPQLVDPTISQSTPPRQEIEAPAVISPTRDVTASVEHRLDVGGPPASYAGPPNYLPHNQHEVEKVFSSPSQGLGTAQPLDREPVSPQTIPMLVTASVSKGREPAMADQQVRRSEHALMPHRLERHEPSSAPWSGVSATTTPRDATRAEDRPAAPQSPARVQTGSGGGTVMLDGRLVGQWLSEHMGREASRPPSGTSFFDPRQTPAWNVSGAI